MGKVIGYTGNRTGKAVNSEFIRKQWKSCYQVQILAVPITSCVNPEKSRDQHPSLQDDATETLASM